MWPTSTYHPLVRLRSVPALFLRPHPGAIAERPAPEPAPPRQGPDGPLAITVDVSAGTTTMFIRGQLDLVTMPLLAEQLSRVLAAKPARLVLDLTRTGFVDCGSARLIATASQFLPPGQRVVLRRAAAGIRRVFELTGLDASCDFAG